MNQTISNEAQHNRVSTDKKGTKRRRGTIEMNNADVMDHRDNKKRKRNDGDEIHDFKENMMHIVNQHCSDWKKKEIEYKTQTKSLLDQNQRLKRKLDEEQQKTKQLMNKQKTLSQTVQMDKNEIKQMKRTMEKQQKVIQEMKEENEDIKKQLSKRKQLINEMKGTRDSILNEFRTEIKKLQKKCDEKEDAITSFKIQLMEYEEDRDIRNVDDNETGSDVNDDDNDDDNTICQKSFGRKNTCDTRTKNVSMNTNNRNVMLPFVCEICNRGYKCKESLKRHSRIHSDDAFVCQICNKRFAQKLHWEQHVQRHTGEKPFECNICHKSFRSKNNCKRHIRNTHAVTNITNDLFKCSTTV